MTALRPTTYRGRLAVSMTAVAFAVLAAAGVLIHVRVHRALLANLDGALVTIARTEIASAFDEPGGLIHVHDQAPTAVELGAGLLVREILRFFTGTWRDGYTLREMTAGLFGRPAPALRPAAISRVTLDLPRVPLT